jgi:UDP-N-acetylmuramoyl-tripeptide--D-alanyl-D-alanine ligase
MGFSVKQMLQWIPQSKLTAMSDASDDLICEGVNTDSRSLRQQQLFIALKGERFDGHHFLTAASSIGAAAMLVNEDSSELAQVREFSTPLVKVPDTSKALQALAKGYRKQFELPLVVVVGSNGKTTVKEMIHSIFNAHCAELGPDCAAHCTQGNFNNEIGLPLTLLKLQNKHRYATIELGMNHSGETAALANIASPSIALINNAQREHQEFMKTVEAVAIEHAHVIAAIKEGGTVVLPKQDTYLGIWLLAAHKAGVKTITFELISLGEPRCAEISGVRIEQGLKQQLKIQTPEGDAVINLNTAGEHNARNALAAIAVAIAAGIPLKNIVSGLQAFEPVQGRMQQHQFNGVMVIDDSYNANPDSVAAAIRVLAQQGKPSIMVLGDMGEVGDEGVAFHKEAGHLASSQGLSALYTLGQLSVHAHQAFASSGRPCQHFETASALNMFLNAGAVESGDVVLVKGSRFMRMENTVAALLGTQETASGGH